MLFFCLSRQSTLLQTTNSDTLSEGFCNASSVFKPFLCFLVQSVTCASWGLILSLGSGLYGGSFLEAFAIFFFFFLDLFSVCIAQRQALVLCHFMHRIGGIPFSSSFLSGISSTFSDSPGSLFPIPLVTKIYFPQTFSFLCCYEVLHDWSLPFCRPLFKF